MTHSTFLSNGDPMGDSLVERFDWLMRQLRRVGSSPERAYLSSFISGYRLALIEAEPKHAKAVKLSNHWDCSECGHMKLNYYHESGDNFCPNCGRVIIWPWTKNAPK